MLEKLRNMIDVQALATQFATQFVVYLPRKEDVGEARRIPLKAVADVDGVLEDPEPGVVVDELGGSSVNLKLRARVETAAEQRGVRCRLIEAAKSALDEAGIDIPFPHLQLFLDPVEDRVWERAESRAGGRAAGDREDYSLRAAIVPATAQTAVRNAPQTMSLTSRVNVQASKIA